MDVWSVKTGTARTGYLRASTVRRVRAWTDAAGIGNGSPLFPSMDRWGRVKQPLRAMQPRAVADAIRSRAAAAGIDRASGHSLRVGAAVSMAQRGAQSRSDAASRGVAVSGHARPLRPPGGRQPGGRRHSPAGRPMGVAGSRSNSPRQGHRYREGPRQRHALGRPRSPHGNGRGRARVWTFRPGTGPGRLGVVTVQHHDRVNVRRVRPPGLEPADPFLPPSVARSSWHGSRGISAKTTTRKTRTWTGVPGSKMAGRLRLRHSGPSTAAAQRLTSMLRGQSSNDRTVRVYVLPKAV